MTIAPSKGTEQDHEKGDGSVLATALIGPVASQARDVAGDTVRGAAKGAVIGGIAVAAGSMLMGGIRRNR